MASILIFFSPSKDRPTEVLVKGVNLKEAKAFCLNHATRSRSSGWFCGFTDNDDTDHPTHSPAGMIYPRSKLANLWRSRSWG